MGRPKKFKQVDLETTKLYDQVTKVETDILAKLNALKKQKLKKTHQCEHLVTDPTCPPYQPTQDYYDLFWKTYLLNQIKRQRIALAREDLGTLTDSIAYIERKFEKYERLVTYRRGLPSKQTREKFTCSVQECGKAYDSEGALELHVKLKHGVKDEMDGHLINEALFFEGDPLEGNGSLHQM